jgi:hypothetical protein
MAKKKNPKHSRPICTATFSKMWLAGVPTREIAEEMQITADRCDNTRRTLGLPKRGSWHGAKNGKRPAYLPSPEEILRKCKEFQEGWTEEEREARVVGPRHGHAEIRVIPESCLDPRHVENDIDEDGLDAFDKIVGSSG